MIIMNNFRNLCTRHINNSLRFSYRYSLITKTRREFAIVALNNNTISSFIKNRFSPYAFQILRGKLHQVKSQTESMGPLSPLDPSSYSRPEQAVIKHIDLVLNIDFEKKELSGIANLQVDVLKDIGELVLDSSDLTILNIESDNGTKLKYSLDEAVPNYGSKLIIILPRQAIPEEKLEVQIPKGKHSTKDACTTMAFNGYMYKPNGNMVSAIERTSDYNINTNIVNTTSIFDKSEYYCDNLKMMLNIKIEYKTAPTATALQWLQPSQTSGKKHPYLFSQCQPIHARSILPCQDSPAVKFTYTAAVTAPEEFTVLMSAIRGVKSAERNTTTFKQPVPIPAYLLAIAVAVLESRPLGPRSLVWSEKDEIERSAWEFSETEKYLQAAERLCGPYQWTQYDLLVLPPSFPYGGMENPCLTFVTPTLLAGDRSQADVIVHEIMHSWTGNLVTNRNFEHFWLNEGFTVYLERKVAASLIADAEEAKKSRDFHSILGLQELNETINGLGVTNPMTQLVVSLNGVHPDDAFSSVPYEKGSLFLRYLEDLLGGPDVFDDFLRSYLNKFQRKSIDTDQFKEYLLAYFKDNQKLSNVDWDTWLNKSGMPPIIPNYDTSMTKAVTNLLSKITDGSTAFDYADVKTFTPHQMINFLQDLLDRDPLPLDKLRELGNIYKVASSKNSEIVYRWLRLCIKSRDEGRLSDIFTFINQQGRMKYVRPIYRDLYAWEDVRERTIENFLKNEPYMMHVSAYTLRKDLHLNQ